MREWGQGCCGGPERHLGQGPGAQGFACIKLAAVEEKAKGQVLAWLPGGVSREMHPS